MEFEKRPSWHSPTICKPIKDEDGIPVATSLSVGILLIEDDEVKWKLMDAMMDSIEKVLKEEGVI